MFGWQQALTAVAIVAALTGQPKTLAQAARLAELRRTLLPAASHELTDRDFPKGPPAPVVTEPPPAAGAATGAPPAAPPPPPADASHDQAWWHARMDDATKARDRDQILADALQSRINALTTDFINRDDPAQKAQLADQRQRAIEELDRMQKQVVSDTQAIADIEEDARKHGVPPGWLRGGE